MKIMITEQIKGTCESCGFAHMGFLNHEGIWPEVRCPNCGVETENFDSADVIEAMDVEDNRAPRYKKVAYKTLSFA